VQYAYFPLAKRDIVAILQQDVRALCATVFMDQYEGIEYLPQ
jgi:hypothetical protein